MPYKLIKGTFHLTGKSKTGKDTSYQPDGDSMHFKPTNPAHLDDLQRVGRPYRLTRIGSLNLRFEGIDATEIHFGGSRQPSPLAEDSRDYLTEKIGMNPVTYKPDGYRVKPPANDGQKGFILSKQLDFHGRPVSFFFIGTTPLADGSWQYVKTSLLKRSYSSMASFIPCFTTHCIVHYVNHCAMLLCQPLIQEKIFGNTTGAITGSI